MEEPQCAARDTSVEGRLGDLENTVRNHLVVYDRLMQSTERAFDKLLERIEELEEFRSRLLDEHGCPYGSVGASIVRLRAVLAKCKPSGELQTKRDG
jgi:hypothetical protein